MTARPFRFGFAALLAITVAGCFVPNVDVEGKACNLQNSCDVGFACVDVTDAGIGVCVPEDAGD